MHKMTDDVPKEGVMNDAFFTPTHFENMTGTRGAFKTFNTTKPKIEAWESQVKQRT
jgi:hypothetical protein